MKPPALLCLGASLLAAQSQKEPKRLGAGEVLGTWVTIVEKDVVPAATALPEDKFSFAPTNGQFAGVRTFAGQIKHLAAANYQLAARILRETPPHNEHGEEAPESSRTKAEILQYLQGAFAYLHRAMASITAAALTDPLPGAAAGVGQETRLGLAIDALAHSYDHYGQIVEYLRMNGVVPPSSR